MPEKLQTFLVNIAILEGRHYVWPNMNSAVLIKIDNHKKCTAVKYNTDCPYYNEYFVFELSTTLEKMIDKNVIVTVIKPGSILRKRKVLGYTMFDVGTVWYQNDHQFYHKWAILTAPKGEFVGGTRGYLKIDVSVVFKGEIPIIPKVTNTDEIDGNLLMPYGFTTGRQRVNFIINIYKGEDFIKKHSLQESGVKRLETPSSVLIEISFSGTNVKTSLKKNTSTPIWNEKLILPELFPPLCQRFKIELYHGESSKRSIRHLNMRNIANDKEEGFLPTFGPDFLHFYSHNHLEGYLGKILMSLETQLLDNVIEQEGKEQAVVQKTQSVQEEVLLKYEDVVLFATIFEVSCINKKYHDKPISFRMACGPYQKELDESGDKFLSTVTPPIKPKITNKNYCFLPINENKPCLYLTLSLPDTRKRMYNYNLLVKILKDLKSRLDKIEDIFNNKDYKIASTETETLLLETLDFVASAAGKYIDIASSYNFEEDSLLDQQRQKLSMMEMQTIITMAKSISTKLSKKKLFQKIEKLYVKIEALVTDVEDWPRVYFWMIYGQKRVAYYVIQPEDVVYSFIDEEKGIHCGVLRPIYFQSEESQKVTEFVSMTCKMDVMMCMGLARHCSDYIKKFPRSFSPSPVTIPRMFIAEEKYMFQCRAHIFQGRFTPGADKSGLCDPLVQVFIEGQCRQTQTFKKVLNPVWDQTLIFKQITLYGSKNFIMNNPPTVIAEIYDKDECCKLEFVGRCVMKPTVKTVEEAYAPPKFPPRLSWHQVYNKNDVSAEILAAIELLELSQDSEDATDGRTITHIPPDIKPNLVNHRIEVVFWGMRDLKKLQMSQVNKPKIVIECVNEAVTSDTLTNAKKCLNFPNPVIAFEVMFPEQQEYAPPLSLKMFDCRNFGISVYAGTHIVPMWIFFYQPITMQERERKFLSVQSKSLASGFSSLGSFVKQIEESRKIDPKEEDISKKKDPLFKRICRCICFKRRIEEKPSVIFDDAEFVESDDFDWWTKFYASLEVYFDNKASDATNLGIHFQELPNDTRTSLANKYKLKIYPNELESQPEFGGFADLLHVFPMYKGKRTGDETVDEQNTTGVFKGSLRVYRWPLLGDYVTASGLPMHKGVFQDFPSNLALRFVLRVYCVRALGLRPRDLNGKSDPYLHVTLANRAISDKANCIKGQINPIFGRCFELGGVFPQDHTVTIAVYDWDAVGRDDLIGQTKIDLENRFYTKHRAHCGMAEDYLTSGYCQWRDANKPTIILENLCRKWNIGDPEYGATSVIVARKEFSPKNFAISDNKEFDRQVLALTALRRWAEVPVVGCALVPEHVETRSLYNPNKPGIEQGKLQLWVDVFPVADLPTPKQVNIAPRKPVAYELRVVVWNAENIKMDEDDFFTGEKKSDVFIRGWLTVPENSQYTDVHYRSLSGEANFNWRFIFPFEYLSTENRIVLKEKSPFGFDERENKIPCRLTLQSWDNDTFSSHDFLGILTLELSRLPRGARVAKTCSLSILQSNAPVLNLFKIRRTRGWWPLKAVDAETESEIFAGALELEFELLKKEDAENSPAGKGRNEPQALPKPNRPDTSFSWFRNPLKAFKFVLKLHKWKLIKIGIFVALVFIVFAAFYAIPGYSVKKILGA